LQPCSLRHTPLAFHFEPLLDDRLIDAFDELLTVEQGAYRQSSVTEAVVISIALEFLPLLLGMRQFLLLLGHALQRVFLATLGLVYGGLQSIRT
jgi:hypothetical protein